MEVWMMWLFVVGDESSWCHHSPDPLHFHLWVTIPWLLLCYHHTAQSVWSRKLLRQHRCGYWQRSRGRLWTLVLSQCAQDTLVALLVWSVSWSRSRVQLDTINGNIMCAQEGGARQHVTIVVRYNSSNCSTHNILTSTIHFGIKM